MKTKVVDLALAATLMLPMLILLMLTGADAKPVPASPAGRGIPVTTDNFIRAESDLYFGNVVKDNGFGRFMHNRQITPVEKQTVVRMD